MIKANELKEIVNNYLEAKEEARLNEAKAFCEAKSQEFKAEAEKGLTVASVICDAYICNQVIKIFQENGYRVLVSAEDNNRKKFTVMW